MLTQLGQIVEAQTISEPNGMVRVLVGGHTLVGGPNAYQLEIFDHSDGTPALRVKGGIGEIALGNGEIAGLLKIAGDSVPAAASQADTFAKALILAFNQVHSTGVPSSGGFQMLQALNAPPTAPPASPRPSPRPVSLRYQERRSLRHRGEQRDRRCREDQDCRGSQR